MYIITNALQNLLRNRGRNLMIAAIIFAIIITTVVSLIINNTASGIIDDYKERFGSDVTISLDQQTILTYGKQSISRIMPEMYMSFADSEYLLSSTLKFLAGATSDDILPIGVNTGESIQGTGGSKQMNPDSVTPIMKLYGVTNITDDSEFISGERSIVDGAVFFGDNECIISRELADKNGIQIGDTIQIINSASPNEGIYNLKVTGIYMDFTDEYGGFPVPDPYMNRRNEIITSATTLMALEYRQANGISGEGHFILKSPDYLEAFTSEIRTKGLPNGYNVSTDEAGYNAIVKPVEGLKTVAMTFLLVVLILGAIILMLLSSIAIRERKYEIGVLRAMGMKKSKVALGLLSETITITLICLTLGLGIGTVAAQPVSDALLQGQIEAVQSSPAVAQGMESYFINGQNALSAPDVEAISEMNVTVGIKTISEIILISLLLACVASSMGIFRITKYEPIKILMERN